MLRRSAMLLAFTPLVLAGCFTGQRPSFADDSGASGGLTGDTAIDAVVAVLDAVGDGPFTATYEVLAKFGNTTRTATVAVEPGRRSITIGEVRYLFLGDTVTSCRLDGTCVDSFDPTLISDTGVTVDFYGVDTAQRLRRDAQAKIAPTITQSDTIADHSTTCVNVVVTGGTAVYCAAVDGPLALLDDGDVRVVLTSLFRTVDASAFTP